MKRIVKYIILAVVLVAVIAGALLLYNKLSRDYVPGSSIDTASDVSESSEKESETARAADFTVLDGNGNEVKLSDKFGKPIIINFWATWCRPCTSELPAFNKAYEEYGDRVEFMMVNLTDGVSETEAGVKDFITRNGYEFPVYYDVSYSAQKAYGASSIPMTICISPDGSVFTGRVGALNEITLNGIIEDLLGEQ